MSDRERFVELIQEVMCLRTWAKGIGQQWLVDELKNRLAACNIEVIDTHGGDYFTIVPVPKTDFKEE